MRRAVPLALLLAAACGGDDGGPGDDDPVDHDAAPEPDADPAAPDAMGLADGPPAEVVSVACDGATIAIEVTAADGTFLFGGDDLGANPDSYTIQVDDIVRISMPGSHNAVSGAPGAADEKFLVNFGQTMCFRFTTAGTYPFFCGPHRFTAQLVVE